MKRILLLIVFCSFFAYAFADTDDVSNVTAYQDGQNIIIEYDLAKTNEVTLYVNINGGSNVKLTNVTGDVGENVAAGHKSIIWDVLSQFDKFDYNNVSFKIETGIFGEKCNASDYAQITIGTQIWMAENYRCSKYDTKSEAYNASWLTNNTVPISSKAVYTPYYTDATDKTKWSSTMHAGELNSNQVAKLGYLYNWAATFGVADGKKEYSVKSHCQGICPNGWHVPTESEWRTLHDYIFNVKKTFGVGECLKATTGWYDTGNGTDIYGFAALPSGCINVSNVNFVGESASFWSATPSYMDDYDGYNYELNYDNFYLLGYITNRDIGRSVRCLKD